MTKLERLERKIAALDASDVAKLAAWFAEFRADLWDRQIEEDAKTGRLDKLVEEALAELSAGNVRPPRFRASLCLAFMQ